MQLRQRGVQALREFVFALVDFVYPPVCVVCAKPVERGLVCASCLVDASREPLPSCPVCGLPRKSPTPCEHETTGKLALSRVRALGSYAPPFETLIAELKYHGRRSLAEILGRRLANLLTADGFLSQADIVMPIPLHPARKRERRFNQSELLARAVSAETGILFLDGLSRTRNTRSQTKLSAGKRFANVAAAFELNKGFTVLDRRVVLVDDVITSGATLDAAARTLLAAGADEVYGLVVAAAG